MPATDQTWELVKRIKADGRPLVHPHRSGRLRRGVVGAVVDG
jgi:hypothetical protein